MDISDIYQLDVDEYQSLERVRGRSGEILINQVDGYRWMQIQGDAIQSVISLDQPWVLINPVNQIMLSAICMTPVMSVLNFGFGGGSFERFLWHYYPEITITSVEPDEAVIHMARQYFEIPASWPVFNTSAESFVSSHSTPHDLILVDIFIDESHPDCLYQEQFFHSLHAQLSPKGILVCNLTPDSDEDLLMILSVLRQYLPYISLYELEGHYNFIIFAANTPLSFDPSSDTCQKFAHHIDLNLGKLYSRLRSLPPKISN